MMISRKKGLTASSQQFVALDLSRCSIVAFYSVRGVSKKGEETQQTQPPEPLQRCSLRTSISVTH
eukprot:scaffold142_cov155-Amphora_coffeaeformis.AAC.5